MKRHETPKKKILIYLEADTALKLDELRHEMRFAYKTDMFESMAKGARVFSCFVRVGGSV